MSDIKVVIKAFRAVDNLADCQKYVEGHMKVLKIFGITMITSANIEWFMDPYTYVILVESENGDKIYGGARIQIAGGKYNLPIEKAVEGLDTSIHDYISQYIPDGTGELCGLWNSREVAGYGIGSIYLGRVGVAIATQLNLKTLFALCAPATVKNCIRVGFEIETSLGNNGTFYYPKEDLLATAVQIKDTTTLIHADHIERAAIFDIRNNPVRVIEEVGVKERILEIDYRLALPERV